MVIKQRKINVKKTNKFLKSYSGGLNNIICSKKINHFDRKICNDKITKKLQIQNINNINLQEIHKNDKNKLSLHLLYKTNTNEIQLSLDYISRGANGSVYNTNIQIDNDNTYEFITKISRSSNDKYVNEQLMTAKFFEKSPHFLYYYGGFIDTVNRTINIFLEKADNTITTLLKENTNTFFNIENIYIQIILSIYTFHKNFGYYHDDTKLDNILYIKNKYNNNVFKYKFDKNIYIVKNIENIVILSDFDVIIQITPYKIPSHLGERIIVKFESEIFVFSYLILDYLKPLNNILNEIDINKLHSKTKFLFYRLYECLLKYDRIIKMYFIKDIKPINEYDKKTKIDVKSYMKYIDEIEDNLLTEMIDIYMLYDRFENIKIDKTDNYYNNLYNLNKYDLNFNKKNIKYEISPNEEFYIDETNLNILINPFNDKEIKLNNHNLGRRYSNVKQYLDLFLNLQKQVIR